MQEDMDVLVVSKEAAALAKGLENVSKKLGDPKDCSTNTGWVMMDNIVQIWMKAWPWEVNDWIKQLADDLGAERTVHQAVKANGGYFPISYPTRLYKLIKAMLPDQKLNDYDFIKGMTSRYPFLKTTNAKL